LDKCLGLSGREEEIGLFNVGSVCSCAEKDFSPRNHLLKDPICLLSPCYVLSRYWRAIKRPPQNLAGAKKLGGRSTARKRPIGSTNSQWGMNKTPLTISFILYALLWIFVCRNMRSLNFILYIFNFNAIIIVLKMES
jgi:hypothetical protein